VDNPPVGLPDGIDMSVPNVARVYDFLLGGGHNFDADRQMAAMIEQNMPYIRDVVRLNRAFLRRAVLYMIGQGITQFLDLGSGIPTVGNVHEIAQAADPSCRVVYVDKEPVAVTHSQMLLSHNPNADAIQYDILDAEGILAAPEVRKLIDFDKPVGLLTLLVWHFVPDSGDPIGVLARYRDALAPGSVLALSHATQEQQSDEFRRVVDEVKDRSTESIRLRSHDEIVELFDGFDLLEPGVVPCAAWRPGGPGDFSEQPASHVPLFAGVARKPDA
jgi:hypothetical protein